jgi:DNA repair exonuclease SbcCD ATPase subunit
MTQNTVNTLPAGDEPVKLQSGADLAQAALAQVEDKPVLAAPKVKQSRAEEEDEETKASNELAETLNHLQNIIERNAQQLTQVLDEIKQRREGLRSVYENDAQLAEADEEAKVITQKVKERKSHLKNSQQVLSLQNQVSELNEQKKEIEEALSNHLINYYQLTNSTSFDTSDGDQWEFNIRAKVKARPKK